MRTCVVIPAHNEEDSIAGLISRIRKHDLEVILVDDGSSDSTFDVARGAGATVLRNEANFGKGSSLGRGFAQAVKLGYSAVITMDADGQHLPEDIPVILKKAEESGADLIIGNRMDEPRSMPWTRIATNKFMSWLISRIMGARIPDTQCGFRLIKREVLEKVQLNTRRYEVESELLIKASRAGFKIESVAVRSVYRRERSKINPLVDTLRFIRFIAGVLWTMPS